MTPTITIKEIYQWLDEVKDPEIPVLSLVDLGVITQVEMTDNRVKVELSPTFAGCPAMDFMKNEVIEKLESKGINNPEVQISYRVPWSSDLISEKGKAALKKFGLAPPPSNQIFKDLEVLPAAQCPRCNGTNTLLKSAFGSTLCRSIYYCNDCREGFEQFKPL